MKAMDNLGAVCGIVICLLLFEHIGFTKLFLIAAMPSLVSAFLIYKYIKEVKTTDKNYLLLSHSKSSISTLNYFLF